MESHRQTPLLGTPLPGTPLLGTPPVPAPARVDSLNFRRMNNARSLVELVQHYDTWAPGYDAEVETYGHKKHLVVDEVWRVVGDRSDVAILDVASGTGIMGVMLQEAGFTDIDALDASREMLCVARDKRCYSNLICACVEPDTPLPIPDESYDVITIAGGLAPNHIREGCFTEFGRILKPGGSLISINPVHAFAGQRRRYETAWRRNAAAGVLTWVRTVPVPVYLNGTDGVIDTFRRPEASDAIATPPSAF